MRARDFSVGRPAGYRFRVDSSGGIAALPRPDGSTLVIGGQLGLAEDVSAPETWTEVEEATGNNEKISDGVELYAGAGFGDPLIEGQVSDVLWALGRAARRPHGRLLEVGSGPGFLLAALQQALPGWTLTGVDPSPESVAEGRGKGLDCRQGFLQDVELEPGFDALVVMGNLQLHPDLPDTLRRLASLAAPGARLYLDSKNPMSSTRRLARRMMGVPGVRGIRQVNAFAAHAFHGLRNAPTRSQLEAMCRQAGWTIESSRTTSPRLLRFGNTHQFSHGAVGRLWRTFDHVDGLVDERSWIQLAARRT